MVGRGGAPTTTTTTTTPSNNNIHTNDTTNNIHVKDSRITYCGPLVCNLPFFPVKIGKPF